MFNSSTDDTVKEHVSDDPSAHKEAVEPDSQNAKISLLNKVLEAIASTDNRPAEPSKDKKENPFADKMSPDVAIAMLQQGNIRFAKGESTHPNLNAERRLLAATESQTAHAYATVLSCSDSRVPVEAIFDAGVMDIFTVRVAGNVCDGDEIGSIEYGLAHVNTPVAVIVGHTQCGAVTAVTHALQGHNGHELERNIPKLIDNIEPAVKKAIELNPDVKGDDIIPFAIEANVWTAIEELFMQSPVTRDFVAKGYAKVVGAIYDIGTGNITWLPEDKTFEILTKVEASPDKAVIEAKHSEEKEPEAEEDKATEKETKDDAPKAEEPKVDKA
ncbi:MAG: carbonic anhydrase [Desulfamplus sp.]|nr:carbonic anhydrase [Desulfamplus sp.]